jgi:hypothetical protein
MTLPVLGRFMWPVLIATGLLLLIVGPWLLVWLLASATQQEIRDVANGPLLVTVTGMVETAELWAAQRDDSRRGLLWLQPWGVFALTEETSLPKALLRPGMLIELTYELRSRTLTCITPWPTVCPWSTQEAVRDPSTLAPTPPWPHEIEGSGSSSARAAASN